MYTKHDYKTKTELKYDVALRKQVQVNPDESDMRIYHELSAKLEVYSPGPFVKQDYANRELYIEGPHSPKPHRWYARVRTDHAGVIIHVIQ